MVRAADEEMPKIVCVRAHLLLSSDDEFASFENWDWDWDWGNLDISAAKTAEMLPGDAHTALATPDNDNFYGKFTAYEPNKHRSNHLSKQNKDLGGGEYYSWRYITSGLTAVWATSNTRGAIFDAMERREVYATTGPRIRLRFFGGCDFEPADAKHRDLALVGYSRGVPMGADLHPGKGAPSFLVYALRDPMGASLDRVQIIKGWLDAKGNPQEKVYDVAWSDERVPGDDGKLSPVGSTVDLGIPGWTNTIGASEPGAVWIDPDYNPAVKAFYFARVIEIPTPRWTACDRVKFKPELSVDIPLITQERAYSSPIW